MQLKEFKLLTDENINPELVPYLRQQGFDVKDVIENHLQGSTDHALLQLAYSEDRAIVTHDNDFGKIIFTEVISFIGVIYLRPGHFSVEPHIQTFYKLLSLLKTDLFWLLKIQGKV